MRNLTNAGLPNCDDGKTSVGSYIQCPKLKGQYHLNVD
jgi:hypothetical protein